MKEKYYQINLLIKKMSDRLAIISILMFLLGLSLVIGASDLNCQVATTCSGTSLFKISAATNAHAEIPSLSNYAYNVCCQSTQYSLDNSCAVGFNILKLSSATNAHVEQNNYTNYQNKVCLSSSGGVSCAYTTQNCNDAGYDACLATISSNTNAHVSDCVNNPYSIKICCSLGVCSGSISGVVKDQNNQPVASAEVSVKSGLTTIQSTTTDQQGVYNFASVPCGTYNLVVSHPNYGIQTESNIIVSNQQDTMVNFLLAPGSSCEQDCTYLNDNIVHAYCDGKNSCTFYDSVARAVCDNSQPGWARDYNETHYVTCAPGSPQPKVEIFATLSCASGTLVKVTRIVVYNGKPVKLVVATCG